jgi:hypothetical protein
MILLRNLLIVAIIALARTVLPGAGNLTEAVLTTLMLAFAVVIGLAVSRIWRETSFTREVMSERNRGIFYAGIGVLALMVVGADQLLETGLGALLWVTLIGGSVWAMVVVWRQANA